MTEPEQNGQPATLKAALAVLQTRLPEISKSRTADAGTYSYTYADLAQISHAVLPLAGELGLSFIAKPTLNAEGKFVLAYKLQHACGDEEAGEYLLPDKGSPQQIGSAITYARRYALCSVTGVVPVGDDDDGAAASKTTTKQTVTASEPGPEWQAPADPKQRPEWYRRLIATLAKERGWDLNEIAAGYAADFSEPIGQGTPEHLSKYLSFLRQQAESEDQP